MRADVTPSMARSRWMLAGVIVGLTTLACSLPFTTGAPSPLQSEVTQAVARIAPITLKVVNDTPVPICALTLAAPGDTAPGDDWLGPDQSIAPGGTWAFSVSAGTYDLQATSCDDQTLADTPNLDLSASQTYTVSAPDGLVVPPPSDGVVVWLGADCAKPPLTPNDPVLIRTAWFTSTEALAEANADHLHFVVSVDGVQLEGVEPIRRPAETLTLLDEIGCGPEEPTPLVSWDLPIGQLDDGAHTVSVEYIADIEIFDGFETYSAGSLGALDMEIEVGLAGQPPSGGDTASLTVFNDSQDIVCFVLIGPPASEWVDDLLGSDVLLPGDYLQVEIVPDTWALQAEDCEGDVLGYEAAYDIDGSAEWHVTGG